MLNNTLLDQETNTKLTLLYLLYTKHAWYLMDDLIFDSSFDRNTVFKYVKLLRDDASDLAADGLPLSIEYSKPRGLYFSGDRVAYEAFVFQLVNRSIGVSLLRDVLLHPQISLDQFSSQHYVSESNIRKKMRQLNTSLKKYSFSLKSSNRQIFLSGDELQIRYYGYIFFWELYKGVIWPFPAISEESIRSFIDKEFFHYFPLKHAAVMHWSYILALNVCRFTQGKSIHQSDLPPFTKELNTFILSGHYSIIKSLETSLSFPSAEINYIVLLLQTTVRFYTIEDSFERCLAFHQTKNTEVYQLFQLYFSVFQPNFDSVPPSNQKNYRSLILTTFMTVLLFPNFSTTISGYAYLDYLDDHYVSLKEKIESGIKEMCNHSSSSLLDNDSFLTVRFSEAYALIGKLTDFDPIILIKLETDLPFVMEKVFTHQLTSILLPFYNISILSPAEASKEDSIDLIISSSLLPQKNDNLSTKTIFIHPRIQLPDIIVATEAIEEIKKDKRKTQKI